MAGSRRVAPLVRINSAASRLRQFADSVASARQRIADGGRNAPGLRERLEIQLP